VAAQIKDQIEAIPQDTTQLVTNEINQIPQQVADVLNIPEAVANAVANLPQQIVQAIKGVLPFATTNPFDTTKQAVGNDAVAGKNE
jgi:archaellum component FlaC